MATLTTSEVSPTVAVIQWRNEIEAHSEGLKVLVWHGSSRETDAKELMKYDAVCVLAVLSRVELTYHTGLNNLRGFRELLSKTAKRFQEERCNN